MSWCWNRDEVVKAKKSHLCELCGDKITIGRNYLRRTGFDEDGVVTSKMHQLCELETHGWDEYDWESFFEPLLTEEHMRFYPDGCLPVWDEKIA